MKRSTYFLILLLGVLLWMGGSDTVRAAPAAQRTTLSGVFTILWGDPAPDSNLPATTRYFITDDDGEMTEIALDENVARAAGGVLALNRQRVSIGGNRVRQPRLGELGLVSAESLQVIGTPESQALVGSQPWISIGCKFADVPDEPRSLSYLQSMYRSSFPGLDHYWREQSYNQLNLTGSGAVGWFTLPQPAAYYVAGDSIHILRAAQDCVSVADSSVTFSNYVGVNFMFNATVGNYSWGTTGLGIYFNGQLQVLHATWLLPWAYTSIVVAEHEMGHGFGMPHSSGNYGQTYDNQWDVMSDGSSNCSRSTDPTFGCLGQHTIGEHKRQLGWLTPITLEPSSKRTITLERLALPQTSNQKLVNIPIGPATHYYTVEARRNAGYDVKLPGAGVIIHEVDLTRGNPAHVVDIDNNGNTGDEGAIWKPGELFADPANAIYVCVNSQTASGYNVTVAKGVVPACGAVPTRTNTPRPGNVRALSVAYYGVGGIASPFQAGDELDFVSTFEVTPEANNRPFNLSLDVVGPCGSIFAWGGGGDFTFSAGTYGLYSPRTTIPMEACPGVYTVTLRITYNTPSTVSTTFQVLAAPTPTKTRTPTRTRTATRTRTSTPTATATATPEPTWIYCSGENKNCTLPGTRLVRFGAQGKFKFKSLSGSFGCSTTTFGGDPIPGVVKHCDYHFNPNQPLPTATPTKVPNATKTATPTRTLTPTPTATATATTEVTWIYCAGENKTCTLPGTRLVRFGAQGKFKYQTLNGSFGCIATTFGGDPIPGVVKHCDYHANPNVPTPTHTPTKVPKPTKTPTVVLMGTAVTCDVAGALVKIVAPKNKSVVDKRQVVLEWTAVSCATRYEVEVRAENKDGTVIFAKQAIDKTRTKTLPLEPSQRYVVRVRACDETVCGAWSKWRRFTLAETVSQLNPFGTR